MSVDQLERSAGGGLDGVAPQEEGLANAIVRWDKDSIVKACLPLEAQLHPPLQHRNIIPAWKEDADSCAWRKRGAPLLRMPLAWGGDLLRTLMRHGTRQWPSAHIHHIMHQLCSAVAFCHAQGLFHLDIKCENVLLRDGEYRGTAAEPPPNVWLADFGSSLLFENGGLGKSRSIQRMLRTVGTPCTAPPEAVIVHSMPCVGAMGAPIDVWGLGLVLYNMVTRHGLMDATTLAWLNNRPGNSFVTVQTHINRCFAQARKRTDIDHALLTVAQRALQANPIVRCTLRDLRLAFAAVGGGGVSSLGRQAAAIGRQKLTTKAWRGAAAQ